METKILIEKKVYKNKELATLIGLDPNTKRLKDAIKSRLNSMGFVQGEHYSFPEHQNGKTAILWVPQTPQEKIPYLCRLLGVNTQIDSMNFCAFVYHLLNSEDFQCRPWEERAVWLKEVDGIEVTERTLRSWCSYLIKNDTLIKDTNTYTWWTTTSIDGEKVRTELADDDELLQEYKDENKKYWQNENGVNPKDLKDGWFSHMWGRFGCKFYKCYAYIFSPWHSDVLQELINTFTEYYES